MPHERAPESFGSWLRQRRKALDLTQAAVAHCVGCAEVTIRKLEAEVARPSHQIAKRLAVCLDLPSDAHDLFLQVARRERSVHRLPPPHPADTATLARGVAGTIAPLPLDTVPPPASLPPGSRMPLCRNPLFVGRDADLRQLAHALTVSETAAIGQVEIAAATGLGGIGKTQLACEFVHRYGQFFPGGVFWLSFADPATVPADVAACGGADGLDLSPTFGTLSLDEQVQRVLAAWKQPIARLLVFDNCEDEALLHQWQPTYGGCRILVTSRRRQWDPALGVQLVPLDVLLRSESLGLLHQFRPDLPVQDADLHAIAEALGDLPLALHLAGSFLAKYRHAITPAQYRARLHAPCMLDDRSLQAAGLSPTEHVQHVARTFEQSYARLNPADPTDALALRLLAHAACCAPGEPIPRWFLLHTLDRPAGDAEHTLQAEDALMRLLDLGLLDTDTRGSLRLHRLVVAFVRAVLAHDEAHATVEATMLRVAGDLTLRWYPQALLTVQAHLHVLTAAAQPRADARAAGLYTALGRVHWYHGACAAAQRCHEQALAIQQRVLGDDHPETVASLNNLGLILGYQGQFAAAQRSLEQALAIAQRVLGDDHPETAVSLSVLGRVLREQGQYAQAKRCHEQALAIQQRVLGDDHPETVNSLHNLGVVLCCQGQYAAAQDSLEQALAVTQRVLGDDHPETARNLDALGGVLCYQGQFAAAQRSLEHALAIRQRVLGPDHLPTVNSLSNLGVVLGYQGQYAEAQRYLEQALAILERVLGADHPFTAMSLDALGVVLQDQGHYADAQHAFAQVLAVMQRVHGTEHPATAQSLHNLGSVLRLQGYSGEAQGYLEQAVMIRQRVLGDDHPDTARSLRGLSEVLHAHGEAGAARRYLDHALTIMLERLGPQHPDTEQTRQRLAALAADPPFAERGAGGLIAGATACSGAHADGSRRS